MKVLHINLNYEVSSLYRKMHDEMQKLGYDFEVLYPSQYRIDIEPKDYLNYLPILKPHDRFFFYKRKKRILNELSEEYLMQFDILHAHSLFSNGSIALDIKKKYGKNYVVAVRNTDLNVFFKYFIHLRKLGKDILRNASKIIFISKSYVNHLKDNYLSEDEWDMLKDKILVIPNGIDQFWLENTTTRTKSVDSNIKILTVGNISKNKNQVNLVKALEILNLNEDYNATLTLVGEVKDKKIFNYIKNKKFVEYKGNLSKENLLVEYRKHHIFALISYKETFGLVYAEALSQNLPIVFTENQGFDNQTFIKEVGKSSKTSTVEILDNIKEVIGNYEEYKDVSKFAKNFNWTDINKIYHSIYRDIIN